MERAVVTFQDQVREFHETFGFHVGELGEVPPLKIRRERAVVIWSEVKELIQELLADDPGYVWSEFDFPGVEEARPVDPVKVAHETLDGHYVLAGGSVNFGFDEEPVFAEVHAANMRKVDPDTGRPLVDENGKAVKPAGWVGPDVEGVLQPHQPGPDAAERAAQWLAQRSRSALYGPNGLGWGILLVDKSKVRHAATEARRASGDVLSVREDIRAAEDTLIEHIGRVCG